MNTPALPVDGTDEQMRDSAIAVLCLCAFDLCPDDQQRLQRDFILAEMGITEEWITAYNAQIDAFRHEMGLTDDSSC